MADNGDRSMLRRVHDATCPGAVANLTPGSLDRLEQEDPRLALDLYRHLVSGVE